MDGEERQDEMEVTGAQLCSIEEKEDLKKKKKGLTVAYSEGSSALLLRFPTVSSWFVSPFFIYLFLPLLHLHPASSVCLSAAALPRSATLLPNDSDQW